MRNKKDARYLNVNIDISLYNELEEFSKQTGVSKTAAVEHGLRMYLDDFYQKNKGLKETIASQLGKGKDDKR